MLHCFRTMQHPSSLDAISWSGAPWWKRQLILRTHFKSPCLQGWRRAEGESEISMSCEQGSRWPVMNSATRSGLSLPERLDWGALSLSCPWRLVHTLPLRHFSYSGSHVMLTFWTEKLIFTRVVLYLKSDNFPHFQTTAKMTERPVWISEMSICLRMKLHRTCIVKQDRCNRTRAATNNFFITDSSADLFFLISVWFINIRKMLKMPITVSQIPRSHIHSAYLCWQTI